MSACRNLIRRELERRHGLAADEVTVRAHLTDAASHADSFLAGPSQQFNNDTNNPVFHLNRDNAWDVPHRSVAEVLFALNLLLVGGEGIPLATRVGRAMASVHPVLLSSSLGGLLSTNDADVRHILHPNAQDVATAQDVMATDIVQGMLSVLDPARIDENNDLVRTVAAFVVNFLQALGRAPDAMQSHNELIVARIRNCTFALQFVGHLEMACGLFSNVTTLEYLYTKFPQLISPHRVMAWANPIYGGDVIAFCKTRRLFPGLTTDLLTDATVSSKLEAVVTGLNTHPGDLLELWWVTVDACVHEPNPVIPSCVTEALRRLCVGLRVPKNHIDSLLEALQRRPTHFTLWKGHQPHDLVMQLALYWLKRAPHIRCLAAEDDIGKMLARDIRAANAAVKAMTRQIG